MSSTKDKITRLGKRKHADMAENRRLRRVDFYKPDQEDEKGAITFKLGLTISGKATDQNASCAAYASAIGVILPDFVDHLKDVMRRHGIQTVDVFIPSQAASKSIQIHGFHLGWKGMIVLFGAGLFLLLKELNAASFQKFMAARLKALKSVVRCTEDIVPNPFTLKQAENIRRVFGSDRELRKRLVETLVSYSARVDDLGGCCRYLIQILDWSGMQVFKCMYDNIFVSKSFVVDDPKIKGEVVVTTGKGGPAFNFRTPIDVEDPEIKRLLKIHRRAMIDPIKTSTHVHRFWGMA